MDSEITDIVLAGHIVVPLMITLLVMPYMIRKLTENGYVVRDYYKPTKTMVPTKGGLVILLVALFSTSLGAFFIELNPTRDSSVVSKGQCRHTELLCFLYKQSNLGNRIQSRKVAMDM